MITTYEILSQRKYKTYTTCQLPGCSKKLQKKSKEQKVQKYCCHSHAKEAQKMYIQEWKKRNKDKVRRWNHRYAVKRREKIRTGEIFVGKLYEYKEPKTYQF